MIGKIFSFIINLVATVIQIPLAPINSIVTLALPDLSSKILVVTSGVGELFKGMGWALDLLPPGILGVLTFVITCEIAKHTIFTSTHVLIKVWNIIQKIKFW